jgi:hypothetical protein
MLSGVPLFCARAQGEHDCLQPQTGIYVRIGR